MTNDNENEAEDEKSHRYNINRTTPSHGHKYTKHKMCLIVRMVISIKQQLSNI